MASMRLIHRVGVSLGVAVLLGGGGCGSVSGSGSSFGGPVALSAFPNPTLTVKYDGGGLVATLDYPDIARCDVLNRDAFARLNGQSVPLSPGSVKVIPPKGDDGSVICTHPSVTLPPFPSDLAPPWTIEIGDATEVLGATFAPGPINPFTVGPGITPLLTSTADNLTVQIQPPPGGATPASARATLTSSDGQSFTSVGAVGASSIIFGDAVPLGAHNGPIAVQIDVDFYATVGLINCQAPNCSLVQEGTCGPWASIPGNTGPGVPCAGLVISSTTTLLSTELACPLPASTGQCN
jgi:hypothetical protein